MVFGEIYEIIRKSLPERHDETLIIGIGGNTGAGKSIFAEEFAVFLIDREILALPWGHDLYQASRSEKNMRRKELLAENADRGDDWWKVLGEVYYSTYDRELLDLHMKKFRNRQNIDKIRLYNGQSGELDREMYYNFNGYNGQFWILHDGVYLFHPKVKRHLDHFILLTTGEERIVSDPELGEITEERRIRFARVAARGLERGYKVDFYSGFLPLDIHTAKHIRDNARDDKIIRVDNRDFNNRRVIYEK